MIYIGIDNGLSGGVVAIGPCAGTAPILVAKMPVHLVDDAREIDTGALHGMLGELDGPATVGVEECPMHSRDKLAMRSMALSYGLILGVLERFKARGWTIHRVKAGNSKAGWQRGMLGGNIPQGQTKKQAAVAAGSIWPEETWIFPRCTKPHDGCIDAALIAEWLRRRTERNAKFWNPGATLQGEKNPHLVMNGGNTYTLRKNKKAADALEVVPLSDMLGKVGGVVHEPNDPALPTASAIPPQS